MDDKHIIKLFHERNENAIAEVQTKDKIVLFDLTRNVFDDDNSADEDVRMFRKLLAHYFSKPNYSGEKAYLVTQYISEYVKSNIQLSTGLRFDGICFSSSLFSFSICFRYKIKLFV